MKIFGRHKVSADIEISAEAFDEIAGSLVLLEMLDLMKDGVITLGNVELRRGPPRERPEAVSAQQLEALLTPAKPLSAVERHQQRVLAPKAKPNG